jgi:hypothetical protein
MHLSRCRTLFITLTFLCTFCGIARAQTQTNANELTFIYIHGFGGEKSNPRFCENLNSFLDEHNLTNRVVNIEWDSVKIAPLKAGASWHESETRADALGLHFRTNVMDRYEARQEPYVLIGFSIGTRVLLGALNTSNAVPTMLRGVYFLGAAMTRDTTIDQTRLPAGMRITNYHSPTWDIVHQTAFKFMNTEEAGGRVGFNDSAVFNNFSVSSTHMHKEVGMPLDYSQLATAIAYLALDNEDVRLPGGTRFNIRTRVGDGALWWNKVHSLPGPSGASNDVFTIEQHAIKAGYFRALHTTPDGRRRRVARGKNMHAILERIRQTN